jgi:hypothetical protein
MYRLFDWYDRNQHDQNPDIVSNKDVDKSVCLALLIFMIIATEPNANAQSFGSRLSKATTKLHESLQRVPMYHWSASPDLLFWTFTMGGLGAKSLSKNSRTSSTQSIIPFFAQYCRNVIGSGVCDSERLLERMKTCLWVPSIFDEKVKKLWVTMGVCRTEVLDLSEDMSTSSEGEREQFDDEYALGQSTTIRFFGSEKKRKR